MSRIRRKSSKASSASASATVSVSSWTSAENRNICSSEEGQQEQREEESKQQELEASAVSSSGSKKSALSASTTEYLKSWLLSPLHIDHPYPTEEEKARIMQHTGIEMKQLTNWFVNNRKRIWKPKVEEMKRTAARPASTDTRNATNQLDTDSEDDTTANSIQDRLRQSQDALSSPSNDIYAQFVTKSTDSKKRPLQCTANSSNKKHNILLPSALPSKSLASATVSSSGASFCEDIDSDCSIFMDYLPPLSLHNTNSTNCATPSIVSITPTMVMDPLNVFSEDVLLNVPTLIVPENLISVEATSTSNHTLTRHEINAQRGSNGFTAALNTYSTLNVPLDGLPLDINDISIVPHSCRLLDPLTCKANKSVPPCPLCSACRDWNSGEFCPWDLTGIIGDISEDSTATVTITTASQHDASTPSLSIDIESGSSASGNGATSPSITTMDTVSSLWKEGRGLSSMSSFLSASSFPVPQEIGHADFISEIVDMEVAWD